MRIGIIAPYQPGRNGVTCFSLGLLNALKINLKAEIIFVGIVNELAVGSGHGEMSYIIRKNVFSDYIDAAGFLNLNCDAVILQHSNIDTGGMDGIFMVPLARSLNVPLLTSFHQVSQTPGLNDKNIIQTIGFLSRSVIAFSNQALEVLEHIYKIPHDKLSKIEYGVSDIQLESRPALRKKLGFEGSKVIFSYGFLSRAKSINSIINVLPYIRNRHENVRLINVGVTEKRVLDAEDEDYRFELNLMIHKSGLKDRIDLIDKYIDDKELLEYLSACDLFVTPYQPESHLQSSTLVHGLVAGAAILSTPYWHADELLSDNRGEFILNSNSEMVGEKISQLLSDHKKLEMYRQVSSDFGKHYRWSKVVLKYQKVLSEALALKSEGRGPYSEMDLRLIPAVNTQYLSKITDQTGVLKGVYYGLPTLKDGYCLMDNALALLLNGCRYRIFRDSDSLRQIEHSLSFFHLMQKGDGWFFSHLSYDRIGKDNDLQELALGYALYALGHLMAFSPDVRYTLISKELFFNSVHNIPKLNSLKPMSLALIGISYYLKVCKNDELLFNYAKKIVRHLTERFKEQSENDWNWYLDYAVQEDVFIPLSLLHAFDSIGDKQGLECALKSVSFIEHQTFQGNCFSPIGVKEPLSRVSKKCEFDQMSTDILPMILLYDKLYESTRKKEYMEKIKSCFLWYMGDNSLRKSLYDHSTGACFHSLTSNGISKELSTNSTLSFWISYFTYLRSYTESFLFTELTR